MYPEQNAYNYSTSRRQAEVIVFLKSSRPYYYLDKKSAVSEHALPVNVAIVKCLYYIVEHQGPVVQTSQPP